MCPRGALLCFQPILNLIFPVAVLISHLPPSDVFGTSTLPVPVSVINTLSVRKLPVTSPVDVFTYISAASQPSKLTSPVLLSTESFSSAITPSREMFPVLPFDITFLHETLVRYAFPVDTLTAASPPQLTPDTVTVPVETLRSREPAKIFSARISPVVVLIFTCPAADAQKSTLPVLSEISTPSNANPFGIPTFPTLPLTVSVPYSDSGR